jgi:NAD(P)H dehydrogenase (quinone)
MLVQEAADTRKRPRTIPDAPAVTLTASSIPVSSGPISVNSRRPTSVSVTAIAATFSRILSRPVRAEAVPREAWGALFKSQGMKDPMPRTQMLDGFNEG